MLPGCKRELARGGEQNGRLRGYGEALVERSELDGLALGHVPDQNPPVHSIPLPLSRPAPSTYGNFSLMGRPAVAPGAPHIRSTPEQRRLEREQAGAASIVCRPETVAVYLAVSHSRGCGCEYFLRCSTAAAVACLVYILGNTILKRQRPFSWRPDGNLALAGTCSPL